MSIKRLENSPLVKAAEVIGGAAVGFLLSPQIHEHSHRLMGQMIAESNGYVTNCQVHMLNMLQGFTQCQTAFPHSINFSSDTNQSLFLLAGYGGQIAVLGCLALISFQLAKNNHLQRLITGLSLGVAAEMSLSLALDRTITENQSDLGRVIKHLQELNLPATNRDQLTLLTQGLSLTLPFDAVLTAFRNNFPHYRQPILPIQTP